LGQTQQKTPPSAVFLLLSAVAWISVMYLPAATKQCTFLLAWQQYYMLQYISEFLITDPNYLKDSVQI
jgi:hypothetical protein